MSELWLGISEVLNQNGSFVTALQVENRFKTMRREYLKTKTHNNRTGVSPKTCPFFELEKFLYCYI